MDEVRIRAEWDRATLRLHEVRASLDNAGVSFEAILRAGYVGADLISTAGRLYLPSPGGRPAVLLGVWRGAPPSIYSGNDAPYLADIIAWLPKDPTRWWYRHGNRNLVLGEDQWTAALRTGQAIAVHPTPLHWLRSNCESAVVLDDVEARWTAARERARDAEVQRQWRPAA